MTSNKNCERYKWPYKSYGCLIYCCRDNLFSVAQIYHLAFLLISHYIFKSIHQTNTLTVQIRMDVSQGFYLFIKLYKHLNRKDFWSWNFVHKNFDLMYIHTYIRTQIILLLWELIHQSNMVYTKLYSTVHTYGNGLGTWQVDHCKHACV